MKKLTLLTAARFFAAFGVFCFHILPRWIPEFDQLAPEFFKKLVYTGYIFVPFFFILSGFVLDYSHGAIKITLKDFFVKRFARIAPAFYVSLCIGAVPAYMALKAEPNAIGKLLSYVAINILFLGSWFSDAGIVNYPAWSIHAEMFFYLLFPFILVIGQKFEKSGTLALALFWLLLGAMIHGLSFLYAPELGTWNGVSAHGRPIFVHETLAGFLQNHPLAHLPEFALGIQLSRIQRKFSPMSKAGSLLGFFFSLCLILCAIYFAEQLPYLWLNSILLAGPFALAIYCLAQMPWNAPSLLCSWAKQAIPCISSMCPCAIGYPPCVADFFWKQTLIF